MLNDYTDIDSMASELKHKINAVCITQHNLLMGKILTDWKFDREDNDTQHLRQPVYQLQLLLEKKKIDRLLAKHQIRQYFPANKLCCMVYHPGCKKMRGQSETAM